MIRGFPNRQNGTIFTILHLNTILFVGYGDACSHFHQAPAHSGISARAINLQPVQGSVAATQSSIMITIIIHVLQNATALCGPDKQHQQVYPDRALLTRWTFPSA
jgi:hypothetical protein